MKRGKQSCHILYRVDHNRVKTLEAIKVAIQQNRVLVRAEYYDGFGKKLKLLIHRLFHDYQRGTGTFHSFVYIS